ncbi:hypothetical protein P12x_000399 [Tundrisphaera lichenicola]|uniref:hypothetical protein n=1 Tax=Tundrisphaera lichenicola TaxID=2029860 RepID=UPI003EC11960
MGSCLVRSFGLALCLFGLYLGLMVLAYASMIDPSFQGAAWWAEYWGMLFGMWREAGFSLAMVLVGGWLLFAFPEFVGQVPPRVVKPTWDDLE